MYYNIISNNISKNSLKYKVLSFKFSTYIQDSPNTEKNQFSLFRYFTATLSRNKALYVFTPLKAYGF